MKSSNKALLGVIVAVGIVGIVGSSTVYAAETIGTVTGKDGDVKNKLAITGEVTAVDGSHVSFKDVDTETVYETSFGPSRYTKTYTVGEQVEVVGVETEDSNNENNHNFQTLSVDGTTLRDSFEGKPLWTGSNGSGTGTGTGMQRKGTGSLNGGSFVDGNGDGVCDNI